jgi:hypothetical protein
MHVLMQVWLYVCMCVSVLMAAEAEADHTFLAQVTSWVLGLQ